MNIEELYLGYKNSTGVSIDSRTIKKNQLFFAIKGDRFDGHKYISQVIEKGASLVIIDNPDYETDGKTVLVESVLICLQELATYHRMQFQGPVLGITGSNGKTSTKELIYSVLSRHYKVHFTKGNLNNHLGVPLTLLESDLSEDIMIIEMGANHIGEIDSLCTISNPNYGLITNIGNAHLEGFGSYEGVIKAKTEIYRHLEKNNGRIFYNQDDRALTQHIKKEMKTQMYEVDDIEFLYNAPTLGFEDLETSEIYLSKLFGLYNQTNIEAAITVGRYFKVLDEDIFEAICDYSPKMNRSQLEKIQGITFIKDAYNANPSSMKLSIKSVMNLKAKSKCLILGDMKELGSEEIAMHSQILDYLKTENWKTVILVGALFSKANKEMKFTCYKCVEDLIADWDNIYSILEGTTTLLKGSRSMCLEKIVEHIT